MNKWQEVSLTFALHFNMIFMQNQIPVQSICKMKVDWFSSLLTIKYGWYPTPVFIFIMVLVKTILLDLQNN